MPTPSTSAPRFPISAAVLVVGWLALPLLILPPAHRTESTAAPVASMTIEHLLVEEGSTMDTLCRDPAAVTRPSRIEEAIQPEIKHALPDGLATRRMRPLPFLEVEETTDHNGTIQVTAFADNSSDPGRSSLSRLDDAVPSTTYLLSPVSLIEYDPHSAAYHPQTPSLAADSMTNFPWSASVSVQYNAHGTVEHAFMETPTKDPALNQAILRSALGTRLTQNPGTAFSGNIQFRCLVASKQQAAKESQVIP